MRLFHAQLMDEHLEGDGAIAELCEAWACLLPRAETLRFTCVVDQVSGTSPTLTAALVGTLGATEFSETTKTIFNAVALVGGTNTLSASYSPLDATYPPPRHLFLLAQIAGANAKAHLQIWVCGRGPQLLEALPPTPASFTAQYAAARMLEDEDRLPVKKRALPQGASLFYPPELLMPSLKWER